MQIQSRFHKTLIILIFFTFLQVFSVKSQFYIGVKGGIGASRYIFLPFIDQDFSIINKKGLVFNYLNSKKWGVHIELDYTQKSWNEITDPRNPQQMDLQYFEIPFLSYKKFGKKESGITLSFGPHFSFLNNHKYTANGVLDTANILYNAIVNYNYTDSAYSQFDYGLDIALGYEFATSYGNFQLNFMYSQGLKDLFSRKPENIYQSLNQNLFFEFTYKLKLNKKEKKRKKHSVTDDMKSKILKQKKDETIKTEDVKPEETDKKDKKIKDLKIKKKNVEETSEPK